jgi:hypothetical protein
LPSSYGLSGVVKEHAIYGVTGSFDVQGATSIVTRNFDFKLDGNDGRIFDAMASFLYYDASSQQVVIDLDQGTGSLTAASFAVNFPNGSASHAFSAVSNSVTGNLAGSFNSATPGIGVEVVPSGSKLRVDYGGASTALPTQFDVIEGMIWRTMP